MDSAVTVKRPPLPQPIAWLYVIAILVVVLAAILSVWTVMAIGLQPAAPVIGQAAGWAIGGFIPALIAHGIVIAIHDLQWRRRSWSD